MKKLALASLLISTLGPAWAQTRIDPKAPAQDMVQVTSLHSGSSVPTVFHVIGHTAPNVIVQATADSEGAHTTLLMNRPARQTFMESTISKGDGSFDLKLNASRLAPGSGFTVLVQAIDKQGHSGPVSSFNLNLR